MKQGSTLFLRVAVILIGIPVLALSIFVLPQLAMTAVEHATKGEVLAYLILGLLLIIYGSAIPFYYALYQAWLLLGYIDKNVAFSEVSVRALKKIRNCAITISGLYVLALPVIAPIAEWDDAPGLILVGIVVSGASMVIAVFAALLQRLLQEAINIKSENDLTV